MVSIAVLQWELDRGGPFAHDRGHAHPPDEPDLLFPQMSIDGPDADGWHPSFLDYCSSRSPSRSPS